MWRQLDDFVRGSLIVILLRSFERLSAIHNVHVFVGTRSLAAKPRSGQPVVHFTLL